MDRRAVGVLVLACALVLVWIVPQALSPGLGGAATRAPLPAPPPVGSCLGGPRNEVVPCSEPHHSEVTLTWDADQPWPVGQAIDYCNDAWPAYVGVDVPTTSGDWQLSLFSPKVRLVQASQDQKLGRLGWRACTVGSAQSSTYVGSVANLTDYRDLPGAFGTCGFSDPEQGYALFVANSSCTEPHQAEQFGSAFGFVATDPTEQEIGGVKALNEQNLKDQCLALAVDLLNVADPTFAGQLDVQTSYASEPNSMTVDYNDGATTSISGQLVFASCEIEAPTGSQLTDSLLGIGDRPLPLS